MNRFAAVRAGDLDEDDDRPEDWVIIQKEQEGHYQKYLVKCYAYGHPTKGLFDPSGRQLAEKLAEILNKHWED